MKNKYKSIQSKLAIASLLIITFLFFSVQGTAQSETKVFQEWAKYKGTQYMYHHTKTITDSNKNAYIIGSSVNANGDYDIMIVKYNRKGVLLWEDIINGTANGDDIGTDLMLDSNDNLIVTGTVVNTGTAHDLILRKYTSTGSITWTKYYNGSANLIDGGTSLSLGANNDIYVGGATYTASTLSDFLMAKYNSNGTLQWSQTYDYVNLQEVVAKITYSNGVLIATGISQFNSAKWEIATLKLIASNGNIGGTYRTGGSAESIDEVTDIAVDNNDNIYIVGGVQNTGTGFDMKIVKLDEDLNIIWTKEIDGADHQNDMANAVQVDNSGAVYITGYVTSNTNAKNYYTAKLNTNGIELWHKEYDGADHGYDSGEDLVIDPSGNVYVTGGSYHISNMDYCTIKYSNNGAEQWVKYFNSEANNDDRAIDITLDDDGDIIIVGQVDYFNNKKRYYTVKYAEKEVITPPDEEVVPSSLYFIENKGQLKTNSGTNANSIKYYNTQSSPAMFVSDDKLHLQFYESTSDSTSNQHRVDLTFNKGNNSKKVYGMEEFGAYTNFLGGAVPDGERERIPHQGKIYSPEVWIDIDMIYTSNNKGMKVYYICKPGFNSNSLSIELAGQDGLSMNGNDLVIENSIHDLILEQGEAYQINSNGQRINMSWQPTYSISGNNVNIDIGSYNSSLPLIIELDKGVAGPNGVMQVENLLWSTFFGSYYNERANANAYSDNKNKYWITGQTTSSNFDDQIGGDSFNTTPSIFVSRFKLDNAKQEWISILSGDGWDISNDIAVNTVNNHCFIVGYTSSSNLIQSTNIGFNDITLNGSSDGFVIELDQSGFSTEDLLQSYIGGDYGGECKTVAYQKYLGSTISPRLYIGGITGGTNNNQLGGFPIVSSGISGAFNMGLPAGTPNDGFIIRFGEDMDIEWSTFFGGEKVDFVNDIEVTPNNVYISGLTWSGSSSLTCNVPNNGDFPTCNDGNSFVELGPTFQKSGFIAQFNTDNNLVWSTLIPKTKGNTEISIIEDNGIDHLYVTGGTDDPDFTTVASENTGAFNLSNTPGTFGYLAKYSDKQLVWRTKLSGLSGGSNSDVSSAIKTYDGSNGKGVIVGGRINVSNGTLPYASDCSTPLLGEQMFCDNLGDYYTEDEGNSLSGLGRMWFALFDINDNLQWATFFGNNSNNTFTDFQFSEDRLLTLGTGVNNTLEEFDFDSEEDYYKPVNYQPDWGTNDGLIAMFDMTDLLVSIDELNDEGAESFVSVIPNPFSNYLEIRIDEDLKGEIIISVYNNLGQQVISKRHTNRNESFYLQTNHLPSGIYLVEIIRDGQRIFSDKLIRE